MKKLLFGISTIILIYSCSSKKNEYLVKFYVGEYDEIGVPVGYLNSNGDTIIQTEKYRYAYTDTIRDFGIVMKMDGRIVGIDQNQKELFEVYKFDNGPDYVKNGLFRIIENEKFGYANNKGKIIIEPKYKCARPFENGIAIVSDSCIIKSVGEHELWTGNKWIEIDTRGRQIIK